jgi:hypothetical protein
MFWLFRGDLDVETILPIIVQIVTGILGSQAIGAVLQQVAMSQLTKIISGADDLISRMSVAERFGVLAYREDTPVKSSGIGREMAEQQGKVSAASAS